MAPAQQSSELDTLKMGVEYALSAAQLAQCGAPGLPASKRGIAKRAREQGWAFVERPCRGGYERAFLVAALPQAIQQHLIRKASSSEQIIEGQALGSTQRETYTEASEKRRAEAMRRVKAIEMLNTARRIGWSTDKAVVYVGRELGLSTRTLYRWQSAVNRVKEGVNAAVLVPAQRGPAKGTRRPIHPAAWSALLSDYLREEEPSLKSCYRRLQARALECGWGRLPSVHSLRRKLQDEIPQLASFIGRKGLREWEKLQPSQRRDKSALRPLEWVNSDGHKCDVFVRFDDGRVRRPILVGWQDVYSGKILSWRLDETENTDLIRSSFSDVLRDYGIPEHALIDNGRAYSGKDMAGGAKNRNRNRNAATGEIEGVFKAFGCQPHFTKPYRARSKPIERAWRDISEAIGKDPRCAGAYTGNGAGAKPANYGSRAVPLSEFKVIVADAIKEHNARTGRLAAICRGRSFDEVFADGFSESGFVVRRATEDQIRWLLLPSKRVRVPATGEACITLPGLKARYFHIKLTELRGQEVVVSYDPHDIRRAAWVFLDGSRQLHCEADYVPGSTPFASVDESRRWERARKLERTAAKKRAAILGNASVAELSGASSTGRLRAKVVRIHPVPAIEVPGVTERAAERQAEESAQREALLAAGARAHRVLEEEDYDFATQG